MILWVMCKTKVPILNHRCNCVKTTIIHYIAKFKDLMLIWKRLNIIPILNEFKAMSSAFL